MDHRVGFKDGVFHRYVGYGGDTVLCERGTLGVDFCVITRDAELIEMPLIVPCNVQEYINSRNLVSGTLGS